ncbi:hypothetical protein KI387_017613, partial [Taxus chinensis]
FVHQKSIKGQVLADQLAEAPLQSTEPLSLDLPDASLLYIEESVVWQIHFDGSFTFHGSGAGVVLITPSGDPIPQAFRLAFPCMNNITEYEALIAGMKLAIKWNIQHVKVVGDSQLIIKQ